MKVLDDDYIIINVAITDVYKNKQKYNGLL